MAKNKETEKNKSDLKKESVLDLSVKKSEEKPATKKTKKSEEKPATKKTKKSEEKPATKKTKKSEEKPATKKTKKSEEKPATKKTKKSEEKPATKKTKKSEEKPATKKTKKSEEKPLQEKKLTKKELEEAKKEAEKTLEEELEEQLSDEEIENFQIEKVDMERLTNRVYDILAERESNGMFQSELWKKLKLTNRDGSRLALKLERMGTITREKLLEKGRWTYKLIIKKTRISTQSIENAPCLVCPVEQKCSIDGEISPKNCQFIEDWVLAEMKKPAKAK